jgi:hypothetical protein
MKTKFKKARTKKDIMNHPLMEKLSNGKADFDTEEDLDGISYWGAVIAGWQVYGNEQHIIHESTVKDFCEELNNATPWINDPELESVNQ